MTDEDARTELRRRANWAFASLLGVGLAVLATVVLLTGDWVLGLVYGLAPGLALGALARLRIPRGQLIRGMNSSDRQDRGRA